MTVLFQVSGLCAEFSSGGKRVPILSDVSLSVSEGEFVALVGESGSGKTMTALSAMHILPENIRVTSGEILLGGENISSMRDSDFRKISGKDISMIFQEPMTSLNPLIRVGKQIEETGRIHGLSKKAAAARARELARQTGLCDTERIMRSYPHELSGGMKQRVMIASALMNSPRLLIADEPTTALDVSTQEEIIAALKNLRETRRVAMLLISHDLAVVRKLCSRVYIMYKGRIIESGPTGGIFDNPRHEYTKALVEASLWKK